MSRGTSKEIGDHFTNQNGYTYEKTEIGWEPIQKLIAERKLERPLKIEERAYFIDGDKTNHAEDNIGVKIVYPKQSPQARVLAVKVQIMDLEDRLQELRQQESALEKQIAESS